MIKMKDRKDIISEYDRTGSIRATARNLVLDRKTVSRYVKEYLDAKSSSESEYTAYLKSEPQYKSNSSRQKKVMTEAVRALIDNSLNDNDRKRLTGDRKLCMKAIDIHAMLKRAGYDVSYPSVTKYIHDKYKASKNSAECYIRQVYSPGMDCEFDWGEMHLTIDNQRLKVYMAVFTLAYSNYRMAFLFFHQDTLAFLESHKMCFEIFSAVPHRMIYDNMRVAVASFVGGKQPTDALLRLERAYSFTHRFCNIRSGNEKGHVERSVEIVRRKAFSIKDSFETLEEANKYLYNICMDLNMTANSPATIDITRKTDEDMREMLPLKDSVCCFESRMLTADKYGTVILSGIHYSVPDNLVGIKLNVHEYSSRIEVFYKRESVAKHEKTPVNGWKLDLMHYISTFERKPGSIAGSAALRYAKPEIQKIYDDHFSDNPSGFILLLKSLKDKGLTLEDFVYAHDQLESTGANPGMRGAIELFLSPAVQAEKKNISLCVNATDIEAHAMDGLRQLSAIMN